MSIFSRILPFGGGGSAPKKSTAVIRSDLAHDPALDAAQTLTAFVRGLHRSINLWPTLLLSRVQTSSLWGPLLPSARISQQRTMHSSRNRCTKERRTESGSELVLSPPQLRPRLRFPSYNSRMSSYCGRKRGSACLQSAKLFLSQPLAGLATVCLLLDVLTPG